MKRIFLIGILLVTAVALTGVYLFGPPQQSSSRSSGSVTENPSASSAKVIQPTFVTEGPVEVPSFHEAQKVQLPGGPFEPADPRWKWWNEMERQDPRFEWRFPINFYGKVVDYETEQPIESVEILLKWTDLSNQGSSSATLYSDANGLFNLPQTMGKRLVISEIKKDGYIRSNANARLSFEYAAFFDQNYHHPDPNNPVVFYLRKKPEAEPLLYRRTLYGLPLDGTPAYLNLRTGAKTVGGNPTGDFAMTFRREDPNQQRPGWTLVLYGLGQAGFVESTEEFMSLAPAEGYQQEARLGAVTDDPNYLAQRSKKYYVRLADGKTYARIEVAVDPKYNAEAAVRIILYLNPSGSQNLEDDPTKRIQSQ